MGGDGRGGPAAGSRPARRGGLAGPCAWLAGAVAALAAVCVPAVAGAQTFDAGDDGAARIGASPYDAGGYGFDPYAADLTEQLTLVVLERSIVAERATGGGGLVVDLGVGERLVWADTRGRVAAAITDRRFLAVTATSASWQEVRFRPREVPPRSALIGARTAITATDLRVLGFDGTSGNVLEADLGPREEVRQLAVDWHVAAAVTSRQVLAMSSFLGGFFAEPIGVREDVVSLDTRPETVVLRTDRRLLLFRARTGRWTYRKLGIR